MQCCLPPVQFVIELAFGINDKSLVSLLGRNARNAFASLPLVYKQNQVAGEKEKN
jgi:hypothetical protein